MKVYSYEKLIEALAMLPTTHRVAFAASAGERVFANYEAFVAEHGAGDPAALREGLNLSWDRAQGGVVDEERSRMVLARVEACAPGNDDFAGFFSSLAQDANIAAYYALECSLSGDPKCAVQPAHCAVESIGFYLVQAGGMDSYGSFLPRAERDADPRAEGDHTERWINESPLMLAELWAQDEDLATLRAATTLTPDLLREMRERSQKGGIQPFERGLVRREAIPANPRPIPPPYECEACEGCGRGDDGGTCARCGGTGRVRTLINRGAKEAS